MGRAPCCEKMGLKKGPWTPEEDLILINYINAYGHSNWRALPKHAGLLRCGKSCRLRWTNYLRPDIKRGNFTIEEEESIINLHQMLGNRWSAIAARLPGRTDNEIKNVWHTHLKKRLPQHQQSQNTKPKPVSKQTKLAAKQEQDTHMPLSPPQCSSDMSTLNSTINNDLSIDNNNRNAVSLGNDLALDEEFWSEVLSADNSGETSSDNFPAIIGGDEQDFQFPSMGDDDMDFWYDICARVEELTELLEL